MGVDASIFATASILKCSTGTAKYVPERNELWFAKSGKPGQDPEVEPIPGAREFFRDLEETLLLNGRKGYDHFPGNLLRIVYADCLEGECSEEQFCIYLKGRLWNFVPTRALLDFVRTHALERRVVTNVPRPNDPTIFLGLGHVISAKDGGRVIVINNASRSHTHRIDPRDFVRAYRTSRFAGGYPLDSKPGCPSTNILSLIEHGVESLFVFWPDSDEKVKISLVQMDDLVSQMERMLAWEDSHPPV